jgi:hypothetical protein
MGSVETGISDPISSVYTEATGYSDLVSETMSPEEIAMVRCRQHLTYSCLVQITHQVGMAIDCHMVRQTDRHLSRVPRRITGGGGPLGSAHFECRGSVKHERLSQHSNPKPVNHI